MCPRRMFLLLSVSSNYHKSGHKKPQLVILLLVLWPLAAEGREGEHASSVWFGESARWWMGIGNTSILWWWWLLALVQLPPLWWGPFLSKTYLTLLLVLRRINRWKLSTLTFLNSKIAKKSWSQNIIRWLAAAFSLRLNSWGKFVWDNAVWQINLSWGREIVGHVEGGSPRDIIYGLRPAGR